MTFTGAGRAGIHRSARNGDTALPPSALITASSAAARTMFARSAVKDSMRARKAALAVLVGMRVWERCGARGATWARYGTRVGASTTRKPNWMSGKPLWCHRAVEVQAFEVVSQLPPR